VQTVAIDGVEVVPLRRIADQRGAVYHMLKATDPHFVRFGEIYFSAVFPGVVKGWKSHTRMISNYACIFGRIKLVLYDSRPSSPTEKQLMELFLGPDEYSLVLIPPGVWHAFQGVSEPLAILANCATEPHDPAEFDRLEPTTPEIPYEWDAT
jgi:dTDP-4-dehydrorhamnose 3,5-epimerase